MSQYITHLSEISEAYQAIFCDVWGVLHNGIVPFEKACAALKLFKGKGGKVILISNSPRPADNFHQQLLDIGVGDDVYDHIVTSGVVAQKLISENKNRKIFHLGPQRDLALFSDIKLIEHQNADLVVCTGLFYDEEKVGNEYETLLKDFVYRNVDFICANPDMAVQKGDKIIPCAGALAKIYSDLGGNVIHTGKPYNDIYRIAYSYLPSGLTHILAIGDSLATDMKGAFGQNLDALLICGALTKTEAAHSSQYPDYVTYFADILA